MSFRDASRAAEAFLGTLNEAKRMAASGQTGDEFDDLLRHAENLLDVMDDELRDFDRAEYAHLFSASVRMRRKLQRFHDELLAEMRINGQAPATAEGRAATLERMPKKMQERIARVKSGRR